MKTHKKLTSDESQLFSIKSAIQLNKSILDDAFHHIFTKVCEHDKLNCIYNQLESFLDTLDSIISNSNKDENDC